MGTEGVSEFTEKFKQLHGQISSLIYDCELLMDKHYSLFFNVSERLASLNYHVWFYVKVKISQSVWESQSAEVRFQEFLVSLNECLVEYAEGHRWLKYFSGIFERDRAFIRTRAWSTYANGSEFFSVLRLKTKEREEEEDCQHFQDIGTLRHVRP